MLPSFTDLLTPDRIALDLGAKRAEEAIREVAALLVTHPSVLDLEAFCAAVLAREAVSTTAAEYGVAFPHARVDCVRQIVIAAGRSREGVTFVGSPQRVHLIFVIGTPLEMVREYLALLGGLARLLKNPRVRERLREARTADEFRAALVPPGAR